MFVGSQKGRKQSLHLEISRETRFVDFFTHDKISQASYVEHRA